MSRRALGLAIFDTPSDQFPLYCICIANPTLHVYSWRTYVLHDLDELRPYIRPPTSSFATNALPNTPFFEELTHAILKSALLITEIKCLTPVQLDAIPLATPPKKAYTQPPLMRTARKLALLATWHRPTCSRYILSPFDDTHKFSPGGV